MVKGIDLVYIDSVYEGDQEFFSKAKLCGKLQGKTKTNKKNKKRKGGKKSSSCLFFLLNRKLKYFKISY